jgi:hypothetical protein
VSKWSLELASAPSPSGVGVGNGTAPSPSPTPTPTPVRAALSTGAIAGIVVGCVLLLQLGTVLAWLYFRRPARLRRAGIHRF